jgi:2-methylcitrate dehydratase PrpD
MVDRILSLFLTEETSVSPIEAIVDFILDARLDAIPPSVRTKAETMMLDCIGVMLAGSRTRPAAILTEFIEEIGGAPQASIIGRGLRSSSPFAALANGLMAHVHDFDDTSRSMRDGHPSAPVLPAVLSLGEQLGASGRDLLEAYIIGTEVEMKIGAVVVPAHADKGWHTTGTLGTLGAAAASCKILTLHRQRISMALGIAASQAAGLSQNFGTMTKSFHAGAAAKNGLMAALLAKRGFTSSQEAVHGKYGFYGVMCEPVPGQFDQIADRLGHPYDIVHPGVDLKRYPSCSSTHCALDGILKMRQIHGLKAEDIEKIRCGVSYKVPTVLIYPDPNTELEARSSMEFCIAAALIYGRLTAEEFSEEVLSNARLKTLMKKIEMYVHPKLRTRASLSREFTLLSVRLQNGVEYSLEIEKGPGSMSSPLQAEEVTTKYRQCAGPSLDETDLERSIELIQTFHELENISELMAILSGGIRTGA